MQRKYQRAAKIASPWAPCSLWELRYKRPDGKAPDDGSSSYAKIPGTLRGGKLGRRNNTATYGFTKKLLVRLLVSWCLMGPVALIKMDCHQSTYECAPASNKTRFYFDLYLEGNEDQFALVPSLRDVKFLFVFSSHIWFGAGHTGTKNASIFLKSLLLDASS